MASHSSCLMPMLCALVKRHFSWAIEPATFLMGEALILPWPFSGTCPVSNPFITPESLPLHEFPTPVPTEMADQRPLLALHLPKVGMLPPGLSPVSLVFSLSSFKSKALSMSPVDSCVRIFLPLWDRCSPLSPADQVSCKPIHDPKHQNSASNTSLVGRYWPARSSCFFLHHSLQPEG